MTTASRPRRAISNSLLQSTHLPFLATVLVLLALFGTASVLYDGFFSLRVIANLFKDNASLGVAAIGMTFVILSGGIDLSIGSTIAFTTVLVATLIQRQTMQPLAAVAIALAVGTAFSATMGFLIARYELPPFLVTLGGMFFARGMAFLLNNESVGIEHPLYTRVQEFGLPLPTIDKTGMHLSENAALSATALTFLGCFAFGLIGSIWTRFGRNIYAIGGSETSARMMGLPVNSCKVTVYAISGLCSALAGVLATVDKGSGDPASGVGFELDAIASVVIGGTLLTGGVGTVGGTLAGVLIFGTIQAALLFDGRLNSWWSRIAIGLLLLAFILFQRFLTKSSQTARHG